MCLMKSDIFPGYIYTCLTLSSNLQDTKLIKGTTNHYEKYVFDIEEHNTVQKVNIACTAQNM